MLSSLYRANSDIDVTVFRGRLTTSFDLFECLAGSCVRRYYDTFNGKLHKAGWQLFTEIQGNRHRLLLCDVSSRSRCYVCEAPSDLRFALDLPEGELRNILVRLTYPRALLPLVDMEFNQYQYERMKGGVKKEAPIYILEGLVAVHSETSKRTPLGTLIEVQQTNKAAGLRRNLRTFLKREAGLEKIESSLLQLGLEAIEKPAGGHSSKFYVPLSPNQRADQAAKKIGEHLLATMELNLPGLCADLDSEFLHDYRIAVRRSRSLLGQLPMLFPQDRLEYFRTSFKWLGHATSPLRDLDVYLLSFVDNRSWLPTELVNDLEPLRDFLQRKQQCVHAALLKELQSRRYKRFSLAWKRYLASPPDDPPTSIDAGRPILTVASRRIWKAYRRVIKQGREILNNPESQAEALHKLRISSKKLRYLLEMFSSLYPAKTMREIIKPLKDLQDNLGDFQDFEVQQQNLHVFADQLMQEGCASPDTFLAMGRLEVHLEGLQHEARNAFESRFRKFANPTISKQFKRLFRKPKASD